MTKQFNILHIKMVFAHLKGTAAKSRAENSLDKLNKDCFGAETLTNIQSGPQGKMI